MKREHEFVKNTLILSIGNFLPRVLSIITVPIISGYLTKNEYGTYDYVNSLVTFFAHIATLQISTAAFRYLIECRSDENKSSTIITNAYAFALPLMVLVSLFPVFLFADANIWTRTLICLYFLAYVLHGMTGQIARGLSYNKVYAFSSIVNAVFNAAGIVVFVYGTRQGLIGMLLAITIAYIVSTAIIVFRLRLWQRIKIKFFSRSIIKELLSYSLPMIPNSISSWVLKLSDRVVLTSAIGAEANAIYGMANKIPSLLSMIQTVFVMSWQENASVAVNDDDADVYYTKMFKRIFVLLCSSSMVLIGCTPWLFSILIKGDYGAAYYQIPILIVADFFYCLCAFQGGIYVAHKKTKHVAITTAMAAVINFLVNIALVNYIGITAASASTLVAYFTLYCFRCHNTKSFQPLSYSLHTQFIFLPLLAFTAVVFSIKNTVMNYVNLSMSLIVFLVANREMAGMILKKVKVKNINNLHERSGANKLDVTNTSIAEMGSIQLATSNSTCCGCAVCSLVCPVHVITMKPDGEGFLYPVIDDSKCIHCKRCIQSCAFSRKEIHPYTPDEQEDQYPEMYAAKHIDDAVRMASRSGGAFSAITDPILEMGGKVYGCILDNEFNVIHSRAASKTERDKMRGSKYVQSDLKDTFSLVQKDLSEGKTVLFSGTPCQVAALQTFLGREHDFLYCIDIVCHGVPSPRVWKGYLEWRVVEFGKCLKVDFRDKARYGWDSHVETLNMESNCYSGADFTTLFYKKYIIRPSCFNCPYKSVKRPGDISLADFWMIDYVLPGFNDNKGVSQIFVNNSKGKKLLKMGLNNLNCIKTEVKPSIKPSMLKQLQEPRFRKHFWNVYNRHNFGYILLWYGEKGIFTRIDKQIVNTKKMLFILKQKIQKLVRMNH